MITVNVYIGPIKLSSFVIDDSDIEVMHHYLPKSITHETSVLRFECIFSDPGPLPKQFDFNPKQSPKDQTQSLSRLKLIRAYSTLGLKYPANVDEAKGKYKALAFKYHPDRNKDPNAAVQFRTITEAFNLIMETSCL